MSEPPGYEIVDSDFGPKLIVDSDWNDHIQAVASERGVRDIWLRSGRLPNNSVAFLENLDSSLLALKVTGSSVDLSSVSNLANLRKLDVDGSSHILDLSPLVGLEDLRIQWSKMIRGALELTQLRRLAVLDLPAGEVERLAQFSELRELFISGCKAPRLDAIGRLSKLEGLDIAYFRKLEDNRFVGELLCLKRLVVSYCSGFSDLSPLAKLSRLRTLVLVYSGPHTSLLPLRCLRELETFSITGGKGYVKDESYNVVEELPKLQWYRR